MLCFCKVFSFDLTLSIILTTCSAIVKCELKQAHVRLYFLCCNLIYQVFFLKLPLPKNPLISLTPIMTDKTVFVDSKAAI